MYLFVEIWKPKASWLALTAEQRGAFFEPIGPAIGDLIAKGLDIISWGINDVDTPNKGGYSYFAAYRIPTLEVVKYFESVIEGSGWYNYFDQINARGTMMSPPDVLQHMVTQ